MKTEEAARKLTAAAVDDAIKTYATAGIKLEVTYSAGSANSNNTDDTNSHITAGKAEGAVNIFVSKDSREHTGGRSDTRSGESFINYGTGPGSTMERPPGNDIISHELGHQFGIASNSSLPGIGRVLDWVYNGMDDYQIDTANAFLRRGITETTVSSIGMEGSGPVPYFTRNPAIDIYRAGAKRFARRYRHTISSIGEDNDR